MPAIPIPPPSVRRKRRGVPPATATLRVLAALIAGYWVAWGSTAFLTLALPMSRPNRVTTASLLCFAVWAVAAMYAFSARSTWRAWWMLLTVGAALYAPALIFSDWTARP